MRILVVDDDDVSALVLSEKLIDLGYHVSVAQNGREAWSMIQRSEFRLLILDWMMPEMDGMELCRRVRERQSDTYTYIILLTGRADRRDRLQALEGGADDFLVKPLDQGELIARLKTATRILNSEEALRLSNEALHEARNKEIQIGAHIQQKLLYASAPRGLRCFDIANLSIPSQAVDGDFCDFFPHGNQVLDVVVGDVMGKGVPAAMVGAGVKTSLQRTLISLLGESRERGLPSTDELVQRLDTSVTPELIQIGTFLTLCYIRLDAADSKLRYVNCGHPKIMLWRAQSETTELLDSTAVPLGFSDFSEHREIEVGLEAGDLVVLYSDGIIDMRDDEGRRLGMQGFADWIRPRGHLAPDELIRQLETFHSRSKDAGGADDFTCVIARYVGPAIPSHEGLKIWGQPQTLYRLREFAVWLATPLGFDDRELNEIQFAIQEAASNAVRHARPDQGVLPIWIRGEIADGGLVIEMSYPGVVFDPSAVARPMLDGSQEGGFGLAIIQNCADSVSYRFEESCNVFRFEKRPKGKKKNEA